ncbi:MAG: hypothetical protein J6K72_05165 [Clostridia bacterium]|nr:hypothetical protein [Clostridia bacterium]
MSTLTFHPSRLHGTAAVPPAKSQAHRALLLAALGVTPCRLIGFAQPLCDDVQAMIAGVRALGATVEIRQDSLLVTPAPASPTADMVPCHVHACAAALRMLIPAFLVRGQRVRFTMEEALFRRPQTAYDHLIASVGGSICRIPGENGGYCSIEVEGRLPAGSYQIDGSQSSQFASGLLIALSHCRDDKGQPAPAEVQITGQIVSRPYLDMTLHQMQNFGLQYEESAPGRFTLQPRRAPSPDTVMVEGDWSQAAVLMCVGALGGNVRVSNLSETSVQGDKACMDVLSRMGLVKQAADGALSMVCPAQTQLMPVTVDCSDIPDIAPILALALSRAPGESVLTGVHRLTIKESDRLKATVETLAQLGTRATVEDNGDVLHIFGGSPLRGSFEADARGDHRLVMLLAAAASAADGPITVHGVEAITKSWPGFFDTIQQLGGIIS